MRGEGGKLTELGKEQNIWKNFLALYNSVHLTHFKCNVGPPCSIMEACNHLEQATVPLHLQGPLAALKPDSLH